MDFHSWKCSTLNAAYNKVAFNEKSAIVKENLHTKYFPFTYNYISLKEKSPIMKGNLCIYFFIIGRVECIFYWICDLEMIFHYGNLTSSNTSVWLRIAEDLVFWWCQFPLSMVIILLYPSLRNCKWQMEWWRLGILLQTDLAFMCESFNMYCFGIIAEAVVLILMRLYTLSSAYNKKYVQILLCYRQLFVKGDIIIGEWDIFGVEIFLHYIQFFVKGDFIIGGVECNVLAISTHNRCSGSSVRYVFWLSFYPKGNYPWCCRHWNIGDLKANSYMFADLSKSCAWVHFLV